MKFNTPLSGAIYPTQSYKGFRYPVRPLFTIALTTAFFGLSIIGAALGSFNLFITFSILGGLTPIFSMDSIILTPLLRASQAIKNIKNGRKKEKSIVSLVAITLGLIIGAVLGLYYLTVMPELTLTLIGMTTDLQALLILTLLPATTLATFAVISHFAFGKPERIFTSKLEKPLLGAAIVIASAMALPWLPTAVEAMVLGAATSAFFAAVISKQLLRQYYELRYGRSNADGYELTRDPDHATLNLTLASHFNVTAEQISKARVAALQAHQEVKAQLTNYNKITGSHQQITDALKNIYHALTSMESKEKACNVITSSMVSMFKDSPENTVGIIITNPDSPYFPLAGAKPNKIFQNPQLSTLFHQQGLESARTLLPNKGVSLTLALAPISLAEAKKSHSAALKHYYEAAKKRKGIS